MGPLLSCTLRLLANVYGLPLLCAFSAYFHAVPMFPGHKVLERSIPWTMRPHQCVPTLDSIQGVGYFQGTHRLGWGLVRGHIGRGQIDIASLFLYHCLIKPQFLKVAFMLCIWPCLCVSKVKPKLEDVLYLSSLLIAANGSANQSDCVSAAQYSILFPGKAIVWRSRNPV